MLMLIGYDLHRSSDQKTLPILLNQHGDTVNLPNGPRFLEADETPSEVLADLRSHLPADELLVADLGKVGAERNLPTKFVNWLENHGVQMNGESMASGEEQRRRVLAIAYTVRIPQRWHKRNLPRSIDKKLIARRKTEFLDADRRRRSLRRAIPTLQRRTKQSEVVNAVQPLNALWFVDTDSSPRDVRAKLSSHLHNQDELFVVEVGYDAAAKTNGWFKEHQVRGVAEPEF